MRFSFLRKRWMLILALLLSAGLKIWLLIKDVIPFNSDEAIVALMARHILGGERPVFFYGQAYMGSLDAWLVAAGFALFGQHVWVIRLIQILLYLLVIWTAAMLGEKIYGSSQVGDLAALFLAVPAVNVTLYTTVSLGGYTEALLLGNLLLLLTIWMDSQIQSNRQIKIWPFFAWGFLSGLGLWAFGLTLIYSLTSGIYLFLSFYHHQIIRRREIHWLSILFAIVIGGCLGAGPWFGFAANHGVGQLLSELGGGAIANVEQLPWWLQIGQHLIGFILLGITVIFGMRPPWEVRWLALPLLPFVLLFWGEVIIYIVRAYKRKSNPIQQPLILFLLMALLILIFILSPFGADPSGRYFLPIAIPLAIFAGDFINSLKDRPYLKYVGFITLVLGFHLWGTVQVMHRYPPGITTQFYAPTQIDHRYDPELINFLVANGEIRGYSNYWVSYPLAFLSDESLIYIPRLPYHQDFRYTERDDRYPAYDHTVAEADRVAYITTNNPALDAYLITAFQDHGILWEETQIGDYHVFYQLSELIRPEEIGLGQTTRQSLQ